MEFLSCGNTSEQIKRHCDLSKYEQLESRFIINECLLESLFEVVTLVVKHKIQFWLSVFFGISLL